LAAILVISSERYSGKSSLVVGLALELRDRGFKIGYMKPVGAYPRKVGTDRVDEDAYFLSETLGLDDNLKDISPYFLTWDNMTRYMRKKPGNPQAKVKAAYERLVVGKDIMLIEGAQNFVHGRLLGLSSFEVAELLDAGVLLLDTFNEELTVDRLLSARDFFGKGFRAWCSTGCRSGGSSSPAAFLRGSWHPRGSGSLARYRQTTCSGL